ncbi:hypothetical protein HMJ29_03720 [Hymenobacter taeanensis]|uniref:Uncharacterized protein n=1 Tax=Hymenobacter taeanensis TaxID=2735321 RepID=A0A6M6BG70_9BACT|nr:MULTISPECIES: hypothetical protein [Hymenobacter]QJX46095.1 hypothetical protein HMJ29_03720 [Hymenobacter taeanensis]UOQ79949.1 hypothetical protein MUN83_13975 [Hymenobacter sp. 5414T-23]
MPTESFTLTPRPDLGILVARWAENAPYPQLQRDFSALLATAQEHNVWRWLLDVRRRDQLAPELGHWTTHLFFPEAAQLASGLLRIAVHCSPARLLVYESSPDQQEYIEYGIASERPYQLRLFIEEGPAITWLLA